MMVVRQSLAGYSEGARNQPDRSQEVEQAIHQRLIHEVEDAQGLSQERAREVVERSARVLMAQEYPRIMGDEKEEIISRLVDEVTGLGPIEGLIRDSNVSEVMVNAPDEVYYERDGMIFESDVNFRDEAHIMRIVDRIVASLGRHVDEASPMVDARLADGSRVNIIIPPLVPKSPVITIRKFRADRHRMADLVTAGSLSNEVAEFLDACVTSKLNIVISGGTGTGKTTMLNALSAFIPTNERIITIEDPIELKLQQKHAISMEARPASTEGRGEVTQRDLVRNALRMRPDRIIVGEVRGSEAFDMMQAMNTGHEGSLTTVHANSPRDALARIENMVLMSSFELPVMVIHEQMASGLHLIIHISRLFDGTRKVIQVSEVAGLEGNIVTIQDIFAFKQDRVDEDGRVIGHIRPTGIRPQFIDRLEAFGIKLPASIFGVERWALS